MAMIIKDSGTGRGLFTDRKYLAGDVVMPLKGIRITREEIEKLDKVEQGNMLQIGRDLFLNMEGHSEIFINHSCNPNCYVKAVVNSGFLIALRPIDKDEELSYDYSLTSTDTPEEWHLNCQCHKFYCRREISGFDTMPEEAKKEAEKKQLLPRYITTQK